MKTVQVLPGPRACTTRSATSTPAATPSTTSTARRTRCPRAWPRTISAAAGAKKGCGCPTSRVASSQATVAARVASTTGRQSRRSRPPATRRPLHRTIAHLPGDRLPSRDGPAHRAARRSPSPRRLPAAVGAGPAVRAADRGPRPAHRGGPGPRHRLAGPRRRRPGEAAPRRRGGAARAGRLPGRGRPGDPAAGGDPSGAALHARCAASRWPSRWRWACAPGAPARPDRPCC